MKTNHAASMLLRQENEPESLARERYEELKKRLEGAGLTERYEFADNDTIINMQGDGQFASFFKSTGSILSYNPELFLAIAVNGMYQGEPKEGQYWADKDGAIYKVIGFYGNIIRLSPVGVNGECGIDLREFKQLPYHLATVEELIEAFSGDTEQVCKSLNALDMALDKIPIPDVGGPEPRKIRKGDFARYTGDLLNKTGKLTFGKTYPIIETKDTSDWIFIQCDNGVYEWFSKKHFTIVEPTESQPAPEGKTAWQEGKMFSFNNGELVIDLTLDGKSIYTSGKRPDLVTFIHHVFEEAARIKKGQ